MTRFWSRSTEDWSGSDTGGPAAAKPRSGPKGQRAAACSADAGHQRASLLSYPRVQTGRPAAPTLLSFPRRMTLAPNPRFLTRMQSRILVPHYSSKVACRAEVGQETQTEGAPRVGRVPFTFPLCSAISGATTWTKIQGFHQPSFIDWPRALEKATTTGKHYSLKMDFSVCSPFTLIPCEEILERAATHLTHPFFPRVASPVPLPAGFSPCAHFLPLCEISALILNTSKER